MPVPVILYPILAVMLGLLMPFLALADYQPRALAMIPCLINLVLGAWMLATTEVFREMEEAAINYRSGCANITLVYMPLALTGFYYARLLSFINRLIGLDILAGTLLAVLCLHQGNEGWKARGQYQADQRTLEALLAKPVTSPGDISTLRSVGESFAVSIPLGCSSVEGLWMFTQRHASITYQRKGRPWVVDLSNRVRGGQDRLPVPSPKSKVRTCGNCDLSLEIPADATPGTKATLGVDVNLSRYPAPASHPVDQRVEKSFLFQVESPKKVEALRLQMAEFTTYELRVNKLKASPPTYASYLNRAIVTGILSLICGLLALARRSSHKPS